MSNIYVVVSVDWEGRSLHKEDLQAMIAFRQNHNDVPMQQFLNPAYYTKDNAVSTEVTEKINSVLLPDDEHGLHIHAWKSLFEYAGVASKRVPNYLDFSIPTPIVDNDWGKQVPIEIFSIEELSQIFRTSNDILTSEGFRQATSFRAGGWIAGTNVLEALVNNNFTVDASAANIRLAEVSLEGTPLLQMIKELWSTIDDCSQPYKIHTSNGWLWEIPNNGCLADYTSSEDIMGVFQSNAQLWQQQEDRDVFVSIGFHQETANKRLDRLNLAVNEIKQQAAKYNLPVVFIANPIPYLEKISIAKDV